MNTVSADDMQKIFFKSALTKSGYRYSWNSWQPDVLEEVIEAITAICSDKILGPDSYISGIL